MVKGILVVAMLVIHASNVFVTTPGIRHLVYPVLLGFVSGSWVFISGFLVSNHYQAGFDADPGGTARRLVGRGLRILAIFLGVNLVLGKISLGCSGGLADCQPWRLIVLGDNDGMTFEILQGIAYVLLMAPLYMAAPAVATVGIVVMIILTTAGAYAGYPADGLTWMLLVGLAGIALGWYLPADRLQALATEPRQRILAATGGLLAWFAFEVVAFLPGHPRMVVGAYVVGTASMLLVLYVSHGWLNWRGPVRYCMDLMARYALLAYMGQMAILMAWRRVAGYIAGLDSFAVGFVVALGLMLGGLELLERLRRRTPLVNRAYQAVFG